MITKRKFILDIFLIILLIPLMYLRFTNGLIHEWLGIVFTVLVFIHLMFNFKWIKSITKNLSNVKQNIKIMYMLNLIVFISYFITIITGILISRYIFLFINVSAILTITLHYIFGYISLIITFVHLILHYKEIRNTIEKKSKSNYSKEISYGTLAVLSMIFAVVIYDKKDLLKIKKEEAYQASESSSKSQIKASTSSSSSGDSLSTSSSSGNSSDIPPTLYEYLSKLHCNGCGNRCLLTSLKCSRGEEYRQMAESDYNEKYNITQ